MKLKRVKILGFKTFADKTEFEFDGDIVAVVGPNGCGKSNIVDSILWGLGETSSKAIRAQTGKEVIFAGSVHRKPHGYAEVTLTFDNEDGALPIDTPEVSVTRRVDRSGQGEYEINRRSCRLKDVADLLADSGLGRAGYAIVGQSDIDQALAASAQQRRAWIDEAAGVHRYRIRRHEAMRRLEGANQHLQRVRDVLNELDAQRAPLAAEAEVAMRYKSALKSLRQVECGLLIKELVQVLEELTTLEELGRVSQELVSKETGLAEDFESKAKSWTEKAQTLETEADKLRDALQKARGLFDQAESALQMAKTRLEGLDVVETNLLAEAGAATERLAQAQSDLQAAQSDLGIEESAFARLEQELSGAKGDADALKKELDQAEKDLTEARAVLAERQKAELERVHRDQRAKDVRSEIAGIDATLPDLLEGLKNAEDAVAIKEAETRAKHAQVSECERAITDLRQEIEAVASENRGNLSNLAAVEGKIRGIEATVEAHEGLAQGARSVLGLVKQGRLSGEYRPVGECIDVAPELAVAIDTALGAASNDLIVADESLAKDAIRLLKENSLGRATFQPLTLMRPQTQSQELRRAMGQPGVIGLASEIVGCKPHHRPVMDSLLGRVLVVETIDDAIRLTKVSGWSRCVTMEGEVVHASGAVTGGRAARQSNGLVQRQAELNEAKKSAKSLQAKIKEAEAKLEGAANKQVENEAALQALRLTMVPLQLELEEAKSWLASLRLEETQASRSRVKLADELATLEQVTLAESLEVDLDAVEAKRDSVWKQLTSKAADAESASARLQEDYARLEASRRRANECERRLNSLIEAESHRETRASHLEPERAKHRQTIEQAEVTRHQQGTIVETLRTRLEQTLADRKFALEAGNDSTESAQKARRSVADAENQLHQTELKRTRLDAKRAASVERLLEEYGVNEETAKEQAPTTVVPDDAATLVSRLRRELKEMGDVNLGAIDAFERLSERHDELQAQAIDIETGMEEVQASVRELDRVTRERFNATYALVKEAFSETFKRVFGGGEGVLELVEGEADQDCGVDIQVTVPGKKRQRLELLSGGERALSALAFLFALLKVKPSPLVILDEIDAPLDGRNVERFIGLMRDFSKDIQFVLITHNNMTIESADVWFGVTMQEPGVSTLVPFKVTDKTAVKAVVPDVYLKG